MTKFSDMILMDLPELTPVKPSKPSNPARQKEGTILKK